MHYYKAQAILLLEFSCENIVDTILHTRKDLAVSLLDLIFTNLYKNLSNCLDTIPFQVYSVSARTSAIARDGYYPLRFY